MVSWGSGSFFPKTKAFYSLPSLGGRKYSFLGGPLLRSAGSWDWPMLPVAPIGPCSSSGAKFASRVSLWVCFLPCLTCFFIPRLSGQVVVLYYIISWLFLRSGFASLYLLAMSARPVWECFQPLIWDVSDVGSSFVSGSVTVTGLAKPLKAAGNNIINET